MLRVDLAQENAPVTPGAPNPAFKKNKLKLTTATRSLSIVSLKKLDCEAKVLLFILKIDMTLCRASRFMWVAAQHSISHSKFGLADVRLNPDVS